MGHRPVVILSQKQDEYTSELRRSGLRNVPSDCPEGTNAGTQYKEEPVELDCCYVSPPPR